MNLRRPMSKKQIETPVPKYRRAASFEKKKAKTTSVPTPRLKNNKKRNSFCSIINLHVERKKVRIFFVFGSATKRILEHAGFQNALCVLKLLKVRKTLGNPISGTLRGISRIHLKRSKIKTNLQKLHISPLRG